MACAVLDSCGTVLYRAVLYCAVLLALLVLCYTGHFFTCCTVGTVCGRHGVQVRAAWWAGVQGSGPSQCSTKGRQVAGTTDSCRAKC